MRSIQILSAVSKRRQVILNNLLSNRDFSKKREELENEATKLSKEESYDLNGFSFRFENGQVITSEAITV